MPELPEVETVKRGLEPDLKGATIQDIIVRRSDLRIPLPENYIPWLKEAEISKLSRRGKFLCIHLNNSKTVIFHLGMSGSITIGKDDQKPRKHDHIIWKIETKGNKQLQIFFYDPRRFGFSDVLDTHLLQEYKFFNNIGLEPLSDELNSKSVECLLTNCKTNIKSALMNSSKIAGIGNIYACEILFESQINPLTPCNLLKTKDFEKLTKNIKSVLKKAIKAGGSSLKDHKKSDGTLGYFQHNFQVYGRENEKCYKCGAQILNEKIAGRSSFFCPQCQPIY